MDSNAMKGLWTGDDTGDDNVETALYSTSALLLVPLLLDFRSQ